jgi:CTP synthase (UTP-ammonia lyase)
MKRPQIVLVGERDTSRKAHRSIEACFAIYREKTGHALDYSWLPTQAITTASVHRLLGEAAGVWCTPGSPYASALGAISAIQYARVEKRPFLGTCGGFQHALIEFSRNVLRRPAEHQELNPAATGALIVKLACSMVGAAGKVIATSAEGFAEILGATESMEEFNCDYGINRDLTGIFHGSGLVFVGHDELGQPRALRVRPHPFFIGTLLQPERRADVSSLHPVVQAFFNAARQSAESASD